MSRRWACLIGQPVAHSLSPLLHNAAFAAVGLEAHYEAHEVAPDRLAEAVAGLRQADCLGANVTAPHKQSVVSLLDSVSEEARTLGAVNTIINQDGRLHGDNTDARGLARWMSEAGMEVLGRSALVLGAGGAARAVVLALARLGAARVQVLNRNQARAAALVDDLAPRLAATSLLTGPLELASRPAGEPWPIVVNTTSAGDYGRGPVVHMSWYSPASVAIELAYHPPETVFMRAARQAGARAENGLGMLVHQAALAFECWTGRQAPLDVYLKAAQLPVRA